MHHSECLSDSQVSISRMLFWSKVCANHKAHQRNGKAAESWVLAANASSLLAELLYIHYPGITLPNLVMTGLEVVKMVVVPVE